MRKGQGLPHAVHSLVISYGIRKPTLSVPETKSRLLLDRGRSPRSSKIRDLVEGTERGFRSP